MEQTSNPQSIERMRGEKLADAFEHFVTDHTAEDNTGPRLRDERSGEYLLRIPSGMLEDLTLVPINTLRIESELLDQDGDPSVSVYGLRFRNEGANVFTISHITGQGYTLHDAKDTCVNDKADERIVATLLALIIDLECMSNMPAISLGGIPASESIVNVNGALPPAAAGELGRTVVRGADVMTASDTTAAGPAVPEKPLSGYALGKKFKDTVLKHANQEQGSDTDVIAAAGTWEVQLPKEMLPIADATIIDNVRFEVTNDIDQESRIPTYRQRNSIKFRSGEEEIISVVRTSTGGYFFVRGEGDQASWDNIEDEQEIIKLLADIESLRADGLMKSAAYDS